MDSGYCTTQTSAEEQAAKKILLQENWPAARGKFMLA